MTTSLFEARCLAWPNTPPPEGHELAASRARRKGGPVRAIPLGHMAVKPWRGSWRAACGGPDSPAHRWIPGETVRVCARCGSTISAKGIYALRDEPPLPRSKRRPRARQSRTVKQAPAPVPIPSPPPALLAPQVAFHERCLHRRAVTTLRNRLGIPVERYCRTCHMTEHHLFRDIQADGAILWRFGPHPKRPS